MTNYTEKNIDVVKVDNQDIDIEKMSDESTPDESNPTDQNSASIGLDLLANVKKMMPIVENEKEKQSNHEEIDLIDDDDDRSNQSESSNDEKNKKDEESSDDSNYDKKHTNHNQEQDSTTNNYQYKPKPEQKELSLDDIIEEKKKMLYEFERLRKRGVPITKNFSLASNLDEMKFEYERLKKMREVENSVMFSRKMLMAFVTAIEFLNNRFDPFELKLDGWSEQVHEGINEYDDIFEELHEKYKSTGKVSPEIKLLLTLGGSAFMFHLTNNIFKSSMTQFENVAQQNPDVINEMMNGSSQKQSNKNSRPSSGGGGGGGGGMDIGGLLGMMSGMGGLAGAMGGGMPGMGGGMPGMGGDMPSMNSNIQEEINNNSMDGPQGVETLLETLSSNTKPVYVDKSKKKKQNKGLDL